MKKITVNHPEFYNLNFKFIEEEWKDIHGLENEYQVSNYGRVLSKERFVKAKGLQYVPGNLRKIQKTRGWLHVSLNVNGEKFI